MEGVPKIDITENKKLKGKVDKKRKERWSLAAVEAGKDQGNWTDIYTLFPHNFPYYSPRGP
jgi:hypothetical protein